MLQDHIWNTNCSIQEYVCYMLLEQYAFQIWSGAYSKFFKIINGPGP